jgi:hypothetical protein
MRRSLIGNTVAWIFIVLAVASYFECRIIKQRIDFQVERESLYREINRLRWIITANKIDSQTGLKYGQNTNQFEVYKPSR